MTPTENHLDGVTILYGSILLFNIILSTVLWYKTLARHYKIQSIACIALLVTGIIQGETLKESYYIQALACSLTFSGSFFFTELLCLITGIEFRRKKFLLIYVAGVLSSTLLHLLDVGPMFMVLPILVASNYPMLSTGSLAIFSKKYKVTFIAKGFALFGVLSGLHNIDFAYAFTHPSWLFLGFTFAFAGIFALTTFSTAAVLETLATDNTQIRIRAEYGAMMASSARLASLGQLASGVAHEINNPLAIIQMHAHQLKRLLKDESLDTKAAQRGAAIIEGTVFRINKIITELRSFSRDAGNDPVQEVSLSSILDNTLLLTEEQFEARGIEIRKEFKANCIVSCRPVQISQVIFNLLNNAFDAIPMDQAEKWIRLEISEDNLSAKLTVTDNGQGISPEIRQKIFHPFFTTKEVGGGAGLGLSSSLGILEANHGTLVLDSSNPFTTFTISLPKA